ncbi:MAG: RNase P subunit p30 family protein [Halobacteriales archaeon]
MFEFVHAAPETQTTPARMAYTAERAGYDAVVLRNHFDARGDYPSYDVPDDPSVTVHEGVEVRADGVETLHEGVRRAESEGAALVAVHGGDETVNRAAVDADADLLAHPNRGRGRSFDHVLAREAAEAGVAVELSLAPVLRASGGERVRAIRDLRATLKLVRKYGTPFVVSADARTHLELRAPRELRAVACLVGIEDDEFERGVEETPRELLADDDAPVEVVE